MPRIHHKKEQRQITCICCSLFCCMLLYVHSSIAIILMGKRELIALLGLSSWCLVMVERLFLAVPRGCLQFVIVVFLDHTRGIWKVLSMASYLHNALIKCYRIIHFWKLEFNGYLMVKFLSKKDSACTCSACSK